MVRKTNIKNWSEEEIREYVRGESKDFRSVLLISTIAVIAHMGVARSSLQMLANQAPGGGIDVVSPPSLSLTEFDMNNLLDAISILDTVIRRLSRQSEIIVEELVKE
jgi:hypothetical protein